MADDDIPPLEDMTQVLEKVIKHVKAKSVESSKSYYNDSTEEEDICISSSTSKPLITEVAKPEKSAESFGGMRKGFLVGSQLRNSKSVSDRDSKPTNGIPFITKKKDLAKDSQFQFEEVQTAMKLDEALKLNQDELLKNIEKNEMLCKRILDPSFMRAINEFQTNPTAAVEKYKDNAEIQSFFNEFCSVIGDHFTTLGDQQPASNPKVTTLGDQPPASIPKVTTLGDQQPASVPKAKVNKVKCHSDIETGIMEVTTRRFKELPGSEEDAKVKEILDDPEIKSILLDPKILQLLDMIRNDPQSAERLLRTSDPELHSRIRKLVQVGLLQIQH